MRYLNNTFLGNKKNTNSEWFEFGDTEDLFIKNRANQSEDWYYRDLKIEYSFNSNGHRCNEIDDIDLSNYILFAGCSHTVGVGLELEKTYPHVVSKKLGGDYYNLAVGAGGVDSVTYNIITWVSNIKQPRAIVIQWPDICRFLTSVDGEQFDMQGLWSSMREAEEFIVAGDRLGYFSAKSELFKKMLHSVAKSPLIILDTHPGNFAGHLDSARDIIHPGINCNIAYAKMICDKLDPLLK